MHDLAFRPLTAHDLASVQWAAGTAFRPDVWRDEHTRSIVAASGDDVVALGMHWTSRGHPDRYWFNILVREDARRTGIGTRTFRHLAGLRAADLPYMTRGYVDDPVLAFADALGARTVQLVPPSDVAIGQRDRLPEATEVRAPASVMEALDLHVASYVWTHADWSPTDDTIYAALAEDFADEVDLEATSIALDVHGVPIAIAVAWLDGDEPLITGECILRNQPDGEAAFARAVRRSLDVLAARGRATVSFDGHVSDPHLAPVLARLSPTGRWFRLVEVPAT